MSKQPIKKKRVTLVEPEIKQVELLPNTNFEGFFCEKKEKCYLFQFASNGEEVLIPFSEQLDKAMATDVNGVAASQLDVKWLITVNDKGQLKIEIEEVE